MRCTDDVLGAASPNRGTESSSLSSRASYPADDAHRKVSIVLGGEDFALDGAFVWSSSSSRTPEGIAINAIVILNAAEDGHY